MENNIEEQNQTISITSLLLMLKRGWKLLLGVTIVILALGIVYTYRFTTSMYRSTGSYMVIYDAKSSSEETTYDLTSASKLLQTVADTTTTSVVLNHVVEDLADEKAKQDEARETDPNAPAYTVDLVNYNSPLELKRLFNISTSNYSYFVDISVETDDPLLSRDICNFTMDELQKVTNGVYKTDDNDSSNDFALLNNTVKIVDKAIIGHYSSPNKPLYLLVSLFAGLVIGVGVVLLLEIFKRSFHTKDEVEAYTGRNTIGAFIDNEKLNKDSEVALLDFNRSSPEPYNKLLSNIRFSNPDKAMKVIQFTSSVMSEGKSTTVANLALAALRNNKKVCLVDLDLRRPTVHRTFNVLKEQGIVEYVFGEAKLEDIIKPTKDNVDVITVGSKVKNPSVVLESKHLKELIDQLRDKYDYVFVDTPPILVATDSLFIPSICDGVVFTIKADSTRKQEVKSSLEQLEYVKANIIGCSITHLQMTRNDEYYYYYANDYASVDALDK